MIADFFGGLVHVLELVSPFLLVALFVMHLLEGIQRRTHIRVIGENVELIKASTELLDRRSYEVAILQGVKTSEKRVFCYWHSLHPVVQSNNYKEINQGLIAKTKGGRVTVKVVIASDPSRIAPAYELVKEGVTVSFKNSLTVSDLRFSLFDDQVCVFGVPETSVPDGKPSRYGFDISSRKLNALLAEHFDAETKNDIYDFYDFVASHCKEALEEPTNSIAMVAEQLRVDECVIEKACPELCKTKREQEAKEEAEATEREEEAKKRREEEA